MKSKKAQLEEALKIYHAKGPVNRQGAQRNADRAWSEFQHLLTEQERGAISIALSHVLAPGGGVNDRGEFDCVMGKVRDRLTPGWRGKVRRKR